jgi:hypothetical protein
MRAFQGKMRGFYWFCRWQCQEVRCCICMHTSATTSETSSATRHKDLNEGQWSSIMRCTQYAPVPAFELLEQRKRLVALDHVAPVGVVLADDALRQTTHMQQLHISANTTHELKSTKGQAAPRTFVCDHRCQRHGCESPPWVR